MYIFLLSVGNWLISMCDTKINKKTWKMHKKKMKKNSLFLFVALLLLLSVLLLRYFQPQQLICHLGIDGRVAAKEVTVLQRTKHSFPRLRKMHTQRCHCGRRCFSLFIILMPVLLFPHLLSLLLSLLLRSAREKDIHDFLKLSIEHCAH